MVRRVLPVRPAGVRRPPAWAGPPPLLLPVTAGPLQGGHGVRGVAPVRRALEVGVASMNLFAQQGVEQAAADARRLTSNQAVDVVGWQETQNFGGVLTSLPRQWRTATVPRPSGIGEIAVSWRRDRFRLERVRLLPGTDGIEAGEGPYPFGGRGILVVTLTERSTGHRLSVVNVHLPPQSESATAPGRWAATLNADRARQHLARLARAWRGVPARWVVGTGDFNFDAGLQWGTHLLDLPEPPTAIFAASDPMAVGVLAAARLRSVPVPQDLSVVGFDDSFLTQWSTPGLTTVRQPLRDMGRVALRTVLRLIAGEPLDSHHVELATSLVIRESTGPISREGRGSRL